MIENSYTARLMCYVEGIYLIYVQYALNLWCVALPFYALNLYFEPPEWVGLHYTGL
jgi:hypothetical protein